MGKSKLHDEHLTAIQKEKGNICVTITVPTHRLSPDRRADELIVTRAIEKATQLIRSKYPDDIASPLVDAMSELYREIDFLRNLDGLGLYISPHIKLTVKYPFPVEEKVSVGKRFEIRDYLYLKKYDVPYYVLLLSAKGIQCYEGHLDNVKEIQDSNFPLSHEDDYEYSVASASSSLAGYAHVKSFEKDKSILREIRLCDFFRIADKLLKNYLTDDTPLILLGPERELSLFYNASAYRKNIRDKIAGNYNYANETELAGIAWPAMHSYLENNMKNIMDEFKEKSGEVAGITGLKKIWYAVQEGRGYKLLIEKDFRKPGFAIENDLQLYLNPPQNPHRVLTDATDELIETVLEKNGQVFFTENGALEDYGRMILITRY